MVKKRSSHVDRWRKERGAEISRPDALRQLAEIGLSAAEQGH